MIPVASAQSGPTGCLSPTVVDGYVRYFNGSTVGAGFNVSVDVIGVSSCGGFSDITDTGGYYAVAGLDIESNTVNSSTTVFGYPAQNSSTATSSTLRLDLTPIPGAPTLTAVPDRHNGTDIIFSWTDNIPDNSAVTDEWELVGVATDSSATSPKTASAPGYASYTWKVRTCYTGSSICGPYGTDTFEVINTAPTAPTQDDQTNTHYTSVTLNWTSGSDSDSLPTDSLVDEFYFDDDASPMSSPLQQNLTIATGSNSITISGLTYGTTYYWLVRTCDNTFASNNCTSSTDSFSVTNTAPTAPAQTDQANTHDTFVNLTWTSGTDSDVPADSLVDEFYFDDDATPLDNPLISNLSIPTGTHTFNVSGLTIGTTYYWLVRTCDNTFASNNCTSSTDSFTISNSAPSIPILEFLNRTKVSPESLSWTSGIDPDGDSTTDEFQLSSSSTFATVGVNDTSATSPKSITLPDFGIFYWRVRTCDDSGECSSYNSSIFQKYSCDDSVESVSCPSVGGGGGGGGGGSPSYVPTTSAPGVSEFSLSTTGIDSQISADVLTITLSPGQSVQRQISLRNNGATFVAPELSITGLSNYIDLPVSKVELDPSDEEVITLLIEMPENIPLGVYAGSLVASASGVEDSIVIILEVVPSVALFDTRVSLTVDLLQSLTPTAGFYLPRRRFKILPTIDISDIGNVGPAQLEVFYEIRDMDNAVLYTQAEFVDIDGQTSLAREITLPRNIPFGKYVLITTVVYEDSISLASHEFELSRQGLPEFIREYWLYAVAIGGLAALVWHIIFARRRLGTHILRGKKLVRLDIE